jgi:hypothetical protein
MIPSIDICDAPGDIATDVADEAHGDASTSSMEPPLRRSASFDECVHEAAEA